MTDKEEARQSFKLAEQICGLLEDKSAIVTGAALGQAFSAWLMNHPPEVRADIAESFKTYALSVCCLHDAKEAYDQRN